MIEFIRGFMVVSFFGFEWINPRWPAASRCFGLFQQQAAIGARRMSVAPSRKKVSLNARIIGPASARFFPMANQRTVGGLGMSGGRHGFMKYCVQFAPISGAGRLVSASETGTASGTLE